MNNDVPQLWSSLSDMDNTFFGCHLESCFVFLVHRINIQAAVKVTKLVLLPALPQGTAELQQVVHHPHPPHQGRNVQEGGSSGGVTLTYVCSLLRNTIKHGTILTYLRYGIFFQILSIILYCYFCNFQTIVDLHEKIDISLIIIIIIHTYVLLNIGAATPYCPNYIIIGKSFKRYPCLVSTKVLTWQSNFTISKCPFSTAKYNGQFPTPLWGKIKQFMHVK